MDRPRLAVLRGVGVLVFAATAFLPLHACTTSPARVARPDPSARVAPPYVAAARVRDAVAASPRDPMQALWRARAAYPYLLVPLWAVGVAAAASRRPALRRAVGAVLLASCAAVAAFEARYIAADYTGMLPRPLLRAEQAVAWAVVVGVLFLRRGRSLLDPAATVSAQALLAALHAFTFPAADVRRWLAAGHRPGPVVEALVVNYRAGFVLAVLALLAVAVPGYTRPGPARAPAPGPTSP